MLYMMLLFSANLWAGKFLTKRIKKLIYLIPAVLVVSIILNLALAAGYILASDSAAYLQIAVMKNSFTSLMLGTCIFLYSSFSSYR